MKRKFLGVLAAAMLMAGCDQITALLGSAPQCHDQLALNTLASIFMDETQKLLENDPESLAFARDVMIVGSFNFMSIVDTTPNDDRGRTCRSELFYFPPYPHLHDVELLQKASFNTALANEVLGISGLRMSRSPALNDPPEIKAGESMKWVITYRIDKTSDGKDIYVRADGDKTAAITDFLRLYMTANRAPE